MIQKKAPSEIHSGKTKEKKKEPPAGSLTDQRLSESERGLKRESKRRQPPNLREERPQKTAAGRGPGRPLKILALDDSPLFRESLRQLAGKHHFEVAGETGRTEELPRLIKETSPDAVLLDLVMPQRDILALIRRLKSQYPRLPLIACSSLRGEHIVSKALEAGCFDYIFKPFEARRLVESLKKAAA